MKYLVYPLAIVLLMFITILNVVIYLIYNIWNIIWEFKVDTSWSNWTARYKEVPKIPMTDEEGIETEIIYCGCDKTPLDTFKRYWEFMKSLD